MLLLLLLVWKLIASYLTLLVSLLDFLSVPKKFRVHRWVDSTVLTRVVWVLLAPILDTLTGLVARVGWLQYDLSIAGVI